MRPLRIFLVAATAVIAVYGTALLYEITGGNLGCCGLAWPSTDPTQAEQAALDIDPKSQNIDFQRRIALAVLAGRPADSDGWLRLAYADIKKHGRLTEEGRQAFDMSYLVLPYGGSRAAPGRLAMALAVWSQLSPTTRENAVIEMGIARYDGNAWRAAREAFKGSTDPNGQITAVLMGLT